jgi:hypothetical protein
MNGQETAISTDVIMMAEDTEDKVLITPDVEQMIMRMLKLPLTIIKMQAGGKDKPKEIRFTERGLLINMFDRKMKKEMKYIVSVEQLNKLLGAINNG